MKKEDLIELLTKCSFKEKIELEDLPEIDLYMDQVIQLFESKLSETKRKEDDKVLTKTMINNYSKAKLLMSVKNKKYSKEHLILMSLIYELKGSLSINDIKKLLEKTVNKYEKEEDGNIRNIYKKYLSICSKDEEEVYKNVETKIDSIASDKEDIGYEEKLLVITSLISISNLYRRIGELFIDNLFETGEEKWKTQKI